MLKIAFHLITQYFYLTGHIPLFIQHRSLKFYSDTIRWDPHAECPSAVCWETLPSFTGSTVPLDSDGKRPEPCTRSSVHRCCSNVRNAHRKDSNSAKRKESDKLLAGRSLPIGFFVVTHLKLRPSDRATP